ncbi:MAG: formate dehydrogenase [Burkholderiales bacterium]|nr:formate dehydrogenase [Burkholderiales bacterium]
MTAAAPLGRRSLFAGVGAVGTLAAVATWWPRSAELPAAAVAEPAQDAGGYRLTDHVRRYYRSAGI